MMNFYFFSLHITVICVVTLVALRFGYETLVAWACLLALSMNLFVLKQITLLGLNVTASDALAVGYVLGLNLIQEFFGKDAARKCMWISVFVSCGSILLTQLHLCYVPSSADRTNVHFAALFSPMPRIFCASFISFLTVQMIDLAFFSYLKRRTGGKYLPARMVIALIFSQMLDTFLFSVLGLYGIVLSIVPIMVFSLAVKTLVIFFTTPFILFAKRMAKTYV